MRIGLLIILWSLGALAFGAQAAEPILIRFSHVTGEHTPKGRGASLFKELVDQRLAGRVRVEVYPRSERLNDDQALIGLLFGDIEMAAPSFSKFRGFTPKLQVFDLPFLFQGVEAVHRFQRSEAGQALLNSMQTRGIQGLAYWDNGMRAISANRPLRAPSDLEGLRFRIEPSSVIQSQYQALDVATVPMPFKQVRDALRLGLVSGQENAWSNIYANGFYEFQKYFTDLGHSFLGYMVITSTDFWNGLPADVRAGLERILAEVSEQVNAWAREQAVSDREKVMEAGSTSVIMPSDGERQQWRKILQPLWRKFESEIGKDLIEAAQRERAKPGA